MRMAGMCNTYTGEVDKYHVIVVYCPDHVPMSYVGHQHN